ncbi:MAG TPA: acyl-CoA dehydrogenase family protein, partial [Pyrinomonadaceae bacterium]
MMREAFPIPAQYHAAAALEQYLGDPADAANVFSFAQAVEADELELYPDAPSAALNARDFPRQHVPLEEGGRLRSYEELLALLRVLARRDFTVAYAYGIQNTLGAAAVWTAGTPQQRQHLARLICDGHLVALAYNEKAHGSDFLATDLSATKVPGGYLLSGEKWLINNATRARALTLIARTSQEVGPRACSLFLIDKAALDPATFSHLPKIKTLGIRGADF